MSEFLYFVEHTKKSNSDVHLKVVAVKESVTGYTYIPPKNKNFGVT